MLTLILSILSIMYAPVLVENHWPGISILRTHLSSTSIKTAMNAYKRS